MDCSTLPDGGRFAFWDDETQYARTYHVAQGHAGASDDGPGTAEAPFRTIGRAAAELHPGEKVVIHEGVYRECVCPLRGGTGADTMIAYEAAAGETVIVKGSEVWEPEPLPSCGWRLPKPAGGATVWMADLPESAFAAYNPFLVRNSYDYFYTYGKRDDPEWVKRTLLRRGMLFANGVPLRQLFRLSELHDADGAFWVEEPGLRLHFRLPRDATPATAELEFTAREQVFAPRAFGLGYIRLSGLCIEHAADCLPVPQRAALSTSRGHHWIIEDCRVEWANGCGLDIGMQSWDAELLEPCGHHVIRRNTVRHCGVCGIAGARGVEHTLIEDNLIEHIGSRHLEHMYECAGIKFHFCKHSLFRRNRIRHLRHAGGIWLDVDNANCRITGNLFADIETVTAALYSEMNYEPNLVDHNVFWDIRCKYMGSEQPDAQVSGSAVRADCNESLMVAHNFFGRIQAHAVAFSLVQADRKNSGRTGLCRANAALNNVFSHCPHRIHLGRREQNRCDGNLYDAANDTCSFEIAFPQPACYQNLAGWQQFFALDEHSTQAQIGVEFDIETGRLDWHADGAMPDCQPLALPVASSKPGPARQ